MAGLVILLRVLISQPVVAEAVDGENGVICVTVLDFVIKLETLVNGILGKPRLGRWVRTYRFRLTLGNRVSLL